MALYVIFSLIQRLDCEQSLFFFRFIKESARARERRSRETRETRAAVREEKDFFVPLPSRAISHARDHLRVSRFARRTTETRETARSLYRDLGQLGIDLLYSTVNSAVLEVCSQRARIRQILKLITKKHTDVYNTSPNTRKDFVLK